MPVLSEHTMSTLGYDFRFRSIAIAAVSLMNDFERS